METMPRLLVTGFGSFPGARFNPTVGLMAALKRQTALFARLGVRLETHVLPVLHGEIGPRLARLIAEIRPAAILHFGFAGRRRCLSIETRACNRISLLHPDARGAFAEDFVLVRGGPMIATSPLPAARIAATLRRAGMACRISRDAGTYLCNAALYHSLIGYQAPAGFIHVPRPARGDRKGPENSRSGPELLRAAELALREIAVLARREMRAP